MLLIAVTLLIAVPCFGFQLDIPSVYDEQLKRYAYMKVVSTCIGEDVFDQLQVDLEIANKTCGIKEMRTKELQELLNNLNRTTSKRDPVYFNAVEKGVLGLNKDFPIINEIPEEFRIKRSLEPFFNSLDSPNDELSSNSDRIVCVLQEIKWFTIVKTFNYTHLGDLINNLDVDISLKKDLSFIHNLCSDLSMCLPMEGIDDPVPRELRKLFNYTACMGKRLLKACARNEDVGVNIDNKEDSIEMDLGLGLGNLLTGGSESPLFLLHDVENFLFSGHVIG